MRLDSGKRLLLYAIKNKRLRQKLNNPAHRAKRGLGSDRKRSRLTAALKRNAPHLFWRAAKPGFKQPTEMRLIIETPPVSNLCQGRMPVASANIIECRLQAQLFNPLTDGLV